MSYYDHKNLNESRRELYRNAAILEASAQHTANLQAAENSTLEKQKRDAELAAEAEKHRQARERELAAERETKRKEAAANFEQNLREQFFAGNPFASESDFREMLPKLRERAMLENTESADKSEAAMRASGNYSPM